MFDAFLTAVDSQNMKVIAVRMLFAGEDFADDKRACLSKCLYSFDFKAGEGQTIAKLLGCNGAQIDERR